LFLLKRLVFKDFGQMSKRHFQTILIINLVNVLFRKNLFERVVI